MIHAAPRDRRCNEQPAPLRAPCVRPRDHGGVCMDERARILHEIERLVRRAAALGLDKRGLLNAGEDRKSVV